MPTQQREILERLHWLTKRGSEGLLARGAESFAGFLARWCCIAVRHRTDIPVEMQGAAILPLLPPLISPTQGDEEPAERRHSGEWVRAQPDEGLEYQALHMARTREARREGWPANSALLERIVEMRGPVLIRCLAEEVESRHDPLGTIRTLSRPHWLSSSFSFSRLAVRG